ncbi:MAG: preprotein translocase subunit SecE [Pirellulaceae bacterium]|nr:preprotein translocase subunit SecE [Pirellulaceae bacterium]
MSTNDTVSTRSFWGELLLTEVYKRNQGRMVRQVTCLAIWLTCFLGSWRFYETFLIDANFGAGWQATSLKWFIPLVMFLIGMWVGYRLVNWPRFADFLISVEAELNKVSWPSWPELYRAALVVIFTIAFLALLLFGYDLLWVTIFQWLKIS